MYRTNRTKHLEQLMQVLNTVYHHKLWTELDKPYMLVPLLLGSLLLDQSSTKSHGRSSYSSNTNSSSSSMGTSLASFPGLRITRLVPAMHAIQGLFTVCGD